MRCKQAGLAQTVLADQSTQCVCGTGQHAAGCWRIDCQPHCATADRGMLASTRRRVGQYMDLRFWVGKCEAT